jgi:hypothetical protein
MPRCVLPWIKLAAAGLALAPVRAEVPEPQPVATDIKVACYYFPGHFNAGRWSPMKSYGHPRPLLGYYRDGAAGVSDWHIKWAVEHGVSCFVFDWYYDYHTGRVGEHNTALDEGLLNADYRDLMEFAIFWCNEEGLEHAPYTEDQMLRLGKVLGERYFSQPNYLRIDGRPALFVSVPQRLWDSFGEGFREVLSRMSRAAGLPEGTDVFLVGKQSENLDQLVRMGFSACTAYNYAGTRAGDTVSPLRATYDDMVEAYEMMWQKVTADGSPPYIVPVSPGWDSRPWYGPRALVRTDPAPGKFAGMCRRAKPYVDPKLNMVIVECWNEFGEGSCIEPTEEFGFGFLDAIRDAFCRPGDWPANAVPPGPEKAAWTFADIPGDPLHSPPDEQTGNLLPWADMEEGKGWIAFDHSPVEFAGDRPYQGKQCLAVTPGRQAKSLGRVQLVFGRQYDVCAWVRCSEGASIRVTAALFGPDGKWLGTYHDIGRTESTEWARVARTVPAVDPGVAAIDVEFVAEGGMCYADDVVVRPAGHVAALERVFNDDCSSGDEWVLYEGGAPDTADVVLHLPAGTGVKSRQLLPAGPDMVYALSARIKCDQKATLEVRSAEMDAQGGWLGTYGQVDGGRVSWQDWIDVMCTVGFAPATEAKQCTIEFVSLGGDAWIRDVRAVAGQRLRD